MIEIDNLELHVTHSCNLHCESCSHYADQGHKGNLDLATAERWMASWNGRLAPRKFSLLGGEPTINPQLVEMLLLSRRMWPSAHLRIVTNGFFLHRHPALPGFLRQDGNAALYLSVHHDSPEYQYRLAPVRELLQQWKAEYGVEVQAFDSYRGWTRRYHGKAETMAPFADADPRTSWERCPARYCPQLHEGKIWKCGPLAYLGMQDARFGLSALWRPYLDYRPLLPTCSDPELAGFFAKEEIAECAMCPAAPERFALPLPLGDTDKPRTFTLHQSYSQ